MSFLSSESVKRELYKHIDPFDPERVEHGAYELGLGPEVFTTDNETSELIYTNQKVVIRPGQMGMLLTEEKLLIPKDIVGFISIKAGIKFRGLINVSGFHVDPGFNGRLKFSVYNAGTENIHLERNRPTFLIWFGHLDNSTSDTYSGDHDSIESIPPKDIAKLQGDIPSPNNLSDRIRSLEESLEWAKKIFITIVGGVFIILGSILIASFIG